MQLSLNPTKAIGLYKNRNNVFFDIIGDINGDKVVLEKKRPSKEITEEELNAFHQEHNKVILKAFYKNGGCYKPEKDILINFNNEESPYESSSEYPSINGLEDEDQQEEFPPQKSTPIRIPSGNLALLQYIAQERAKKSEDLEYRNRKLEAENEKMKDKILKLENALNLKDREHELIIQSKDNDSKNSLSGFMESAAKPEFLNALPGILSALKGTGVAQLPGADLLAGIDETHRATLKEMVDYLKTTPEQTAKIYLITTKTSRNPGLSEKIIKTIEKFN